MLFLRELVDVGEPMPTRADLETRSRWNLWKTRVHPYNQIEEGTPLVLVYAWADRGRQAGHMTWVVKAEAVVKATYTSKPKAVRTIARALNRPVGHVRDHPYTTHAPARGVLVAFRFKPVRRIDRPRPPDMTFRQNGWLLVDDKRVLDRWGITDIKQARQHPRGIFVEPVAGQGRLGLAERLEVEDRAMTKAIQWCHDNGWRYVADVSRHKSWDLEARRTANDKPTFIEVKGTTGQRPLVDVTAAEVKHAKAHPKSTVLIVVTSILLRRGPNPTASGGQVHVWQPWEPHDSELTPKVYRWAHRGGT